MPERRYRVGVPVAAWWHQDLRHSSPPCHREGSLSSRVAGSDLKTDLPSLNAGTTIQSWRPCCSVVASRPKAFIATMPSGGIPLEPSRVLSPDRTRPVRYQLRLPVATASGETSPPAI